jgi:DNA primase
MAAKDVVELEVAGHTVRITSPDKVFFAERGETKLDLVRYYEAVAEPLLRTMAGRPTLMQRFPDGASGKSFFQKRVPNGAPDWLTTMVVSTPNGTTSNALVSQDLAHILWAVNMGCLGFHTWPYHRDDPDHADELRIDLDPQPGIVFDHAGGGGRGQGPLRRARHRGPCQDHGQPGPAHLRAVAPRMGQLPGAGLCRGRGP